MFILPWGRHIASQLEYDFKNSTQKQQEMLATDIDLKPRSIWYLSTINRSANRPRIENVSISRRLTFRMFCVGNDQVRFARIHYQLRVLQIRRKHNKTCKTYFESSFSSTKAIKVKGRFDWLASESRYFITTNCRERTQVSIRNKNNKLWNMLWKHFWLTGHAAGNKHGFSSLHSRRNFGERVLSIS